MRSKVLALYVVSIVLGSIVGLVGSTFRLSIDLLSTTFASFFHFMAQHGWPAGLISGLVSMLLVLTAFCAVKYIAPEAAGSGVPEIEGALLHKRPVFWRRLLPVKFFFGICALSANMILGREGPTIHIGGSLGEMLGNLWGMTRRRCDSLIAAGAGAGLAVAFNAPLAGVIFVIEEMHSQFKYSFTSFSVVMVSCITATVVMDLLIGTQATIQMSIFQFPDLKSLWLFALFGFIVGYAGLLFNKALIASLEFTDKLTSKQKVFYVMLIGFIVGYVSVYFPSAVGDGMQIIHQSLVFFPGLSALCFLFLVRFIGSIACYSTSVPGGIFAPTLALGTILGLAMFHLLELLHLDFLTQPGMFAVAGMAAFFAAVTRASITGSVLVVEMTQNYLLIFPLMIACITATIVLQLAHNGPIYEQLLNRTLRHPAKDKKNQSL